MLWLRYSKYLLIAFVCGMWLILALLVWHHTYIYIYICIFAWWARGWFSDVMESKTFAGYYRDNEKSKKKHRWMVFLQTTLNHDLLGNKQYSIWFDLINFTNHINIWSNFPRLHVCVCFFDLKKIKSGVDSPLVNILLTLAQWFLVRV